MDKSKVNEKIGNLKGSVSQGVDKAKDTLKDKYTGSIADTEKKGSINSDKKNFRNDRH